MYFWTVDLLGSSEVSRADSAEEVFGKGQRTAVSPTRRSGSTVQALCDITFE